MTRARGMAAVMPQPQSLPVNKISTADIVAAFRGRHRHARRRIFDDPYAHLLCGRFLGFAVRFRPLGWLLVKIVLRRLTPAGMCVLMRARYAEQALEAAVAEGVSQYVIIGAGMDSFIFRRRDLLERIDVFEIDHPVTQRKKLERIRRAGLTVPARCRFVAADLSKVAVVDALAGSGFDCSKPTFLSLLGVVYYLTPDSLAALARSIAGGLAPGTRLVIDYLLDEKSCNPAHLRIRERMLAFVRSRGEPMRSEYATEAMSGLFAANGFRAVENFAIQSLEASYIETFGALPFEIPGIFAFGEFQVVERDARAAEQPKNAAAVESPA